MSYEMGEAGSLVWSVDVMGLWLMVVLTSLTHSLGQSEAGLIKGMALGTLHMSAAFYGQSRGCGSGWAVLIGKPNW